MSAKRLLPKRNDCRRFASWFQETAKFGWPGLYHSYFTSPPHSLSLSLSASPPRSPTQREQTTDIRTQTHTHRHKDSHTLIYTSTITYTCYWYLYELWNPLRFVWDCKRRISLEVARFPFFLWIPSNLGTWMNNDYVYLPCSSKVLAQRISTCCIQSWCWDGERKNKKRRKKRKGKKPTKNVARNRRNIRGLFFFFFGWGCSEHDFKHPWLASDLSCHILSFLSFITIRLSTVWLCFFKSIIQSLFLPFWLSSRPLIELLFVWPWSTADLIQSGSWALIMFRRHFRRPGICNLKQSSLLGATCQGLCVCPAAHLLVCLLVYQSNCICMLCAKAFGKPYLHCVTNLRTS